MRKKNETTSIERLPEFISDWQPIGHAAGRRPALPERASVRRSSLGSWFGRKLFLAIAIDITLLMTMSQPGEGTETDRIRNGGK